MYCLVEQDRRQISQHEVHEHTKSSYSIARGRARGKEIDRDREREREIGRERERGREIFIAVSHLFPLEEVYARKADWLFVMDQAMLCLHMLTDVSLARETWVSCKCLQAFFSSGHSVPCMWLRRDAW